MLPFIVEQSVEVQIPILILVKQCLNIKVVVSSVNKARAVAVVDRAPRANALLLEDMADARLLVYLEEPASPEILVLEETGHVAGG
jgi:hypothetical protein